MTISESNDVAPRVAFARALRGRNAEETRLLLLRYPELRRSINEPLDGGDFGAKPIHIAARSKDPELVDVLISAGADINGRTDWWAGSFGVLDICDPASAPFLIDRGAVVDAYAASRLGMLDSLRALVADDPQVVSMRGGDGQTPLHLAANVAIATCLLDAGADIDALDVDHESTPAQYAIGERPDVARYLVSLGAKCDILMATALGDVDRVTRMLDADPNAIRTTVDRAFFPMKNPRAGGSIYIWTLGGNKDALQIARDRKHAELLALLRARAPETLKFAFACENGDEATISEMLRANPALPMSLGAAEARRLIDAAEAGKNDSVSRMLRLGWPVSARNDSQTTALHWAAWHGNASMVADLVDAGADVNARETMFDGVPLGWAIHGSLNSWRRVSGDYKTVVKELLKAGGKLPRPGESEASAAVHAAFAEAAEE